MKKTLAILLLSAMIMSFLFSCTKKDDAPEGLQIGMESPRGYIFYAPDNWMLINSDDVCAARVSRINETSISFTEGKMPKTSIPEYFAESLEEFPASIKESLKVTLKDEKCSFGNANGEAYKYVYSYKYEEKQIACMQILLTHGDRFFIFTYTSDGDVADEGSNYRRYLDIVQTAITEFKFTENCGTEEKNPVYATDSDGYNLVSDKSVCGFGLYLPKEYDVRFSNGFVKAKITDGANITMSKATETNVKIIDYLKTRKDKLSKFTTDFKDVGIYLGTEINPDSPSFADWKFDVAASFDETLCFGELKKNLIIAYEYTYTLGGERYSVYQVMGVDSRNGYVFTYTALEEEYQTHIEEIKNILKKVVF